MKSMCHDSRRNSPSVAERSPISSCLRTISAIASSSTARSSSASMTAGGVVLARLQQPLRAEQAADVVGAERGLGACAHRNDLLGSQDQCWKNAVARSPCRCTSKRYPSPLRRATIVSSSAPSGSR